MTPSSRPLPTAHPSPPPMALSHPSTIAHPQGPPWQRRPRRARIVARRVARNVNRRSDHGYFSIQTSAPSCQACLNQSCRLFPSEFRARARARAAVTYRVGRRTVQIRFKLIMVSNQMNAAIIQIIFKQQHSHSLSSLFSNRADTNTNTFASSVSLSLSDSARAETGATKVRARGWKKNNSCSLFCCRQGGGWTVRGAGVDAETVRRVGRAARRAGPSARVRRGASPGRGFRSAPAGMCVGQGEEGAGGRLRREGGAVARG